MNTKQKIPSEMRNIFESGITNNMSIENNLIPATNTINQHEILEPLPVVMGDDIIVNIDDEIKDPKALVSVLTVMLFSAGNISVIGGKQCKSSA